MRRRYVSRDPYWLTVRWDGECSMCHRPIKKGERAFYYPNGKKLCCDDEACGQACYLEFTAACADEQNCCW